MVNCDILCHDHLTIKKENQKAKSSINIDLSYNLEPNQFNLDSLLTHT